MANLHVTITEEILLPNTTKEKTNVFKTISNVNQILRRVDTISTTFSGSGIEILRFCDSEEEQSGGAFLKSEVKYIRITNLSTTYDTSLYLYADNSEISVFNLNPGKTFMLSDADMNSFSMSDYVDPTYVDVSYFSSYQYINSIKAKALLGNTQLEYFVAST